MELPALFVNFKTYEEGTGEKAESLAELCENISLETKKTIVPVVQVSDLYRVSRVVDIPVYSQTVDPVGYGSNTGSVLPEGLKKNGAHGAVINHFEDRKDFSAIERCINRSNELFLETMVCAKDPEEAGEISQLDPDLVAIEPPELIGSDASVSTVKPEIITESLEKVSQPLICGAGIKSREDVERAVRLGADGVFVASGVVKAGNIEEEIRELVEPL